MKFFCFYPAILFLLPQFVLAQPVAVESKGKKVSFVAVGKPSMLKIRGEGENLDIKLDETTGIVKGAIEFKLDSLNTGIDLRDSHMKEKYLETKKFPTARLEIKDLKLVKPIAQTGESKGVAFKAALTLHGVTKDVDGQYDITPKEGALEVHATYSVKVSDYGIAIPSYMGITVTDQVAVETSFTIKK